MNKYSILGLLVSSCFLAACGQQAETQTASAASTVEPASNTIEATASETSQAAASSQEVSASETEASAAYDGPVKSYTAFGNTPKPWRIVVTGNAEATGNRLVLEGENLQGSFEVERAAYAKGVEFNGTQDNVEFGLNIKGETCKDNAGNEHEFTATFDYGGVRYKGCAERGALEHAPT